MGRGTNKKILSDKIEPVYIFAGTDTYTKEKIEKEIESRLQKQYGNCEVVSMDAKTHEPNAIMSEILNSTLFSNIKLVKIKNGDTLLSNDSFKDFIIDFYDTENPPSIVVLETEKSKKIKKLTIHKIDTPYDNQIPNWIRENMQSYGKYITDDAANLLAFYCGRNLHNISSEIKKIITAHPDKETYHIEEIRSISGSYKNDDIFAYLNALEASDEKKSLLFLNNLLKFGTEPVQIVAMLKWKIQQMIVARTLMDQGLKEREIIQKMKLLPYFYKGFCMKLKKFTAKKLLESYDSLCSLDMDLKSSSTDKFLLLENFTFQFLLN
jgi:DNA polymerase-3 subunit delta